MPQNLFDLPEYGMDLKMYEYKQKILTNISELVKMVFAFQLLSFSTTSVSRGMYYLLPLSAISYSREGHIFAFTLAVDLFLKIRKKPRFEKLICFLAILVYIIPLGTTNIIFTQTWFTKLTSLVIYQALSFRVLTGKL